MPGSLCRNLSENSDKQYQVLTPVRLDHVTQADDSSVSKVYVSYAQRIMITPENASSVFNNLPPSSYDDENEEPDNVFLDGFIKVFRELPKDLFVDQLVRDLHSCESSLEHMRDELFEQVKEFDNFPYGSQCHLKKRVQTRNGDLVAIKLARDIHTVVSVIEGNDITDLRDVVSAGKQRTQRSQSASCTGVRRNQHLQDQCECSTMIVELSKTVNILTADVLTMKQKFGELESLREQQMQSVEIAMIDVSKLIKTLSVAMTEGVAETKLGLERIQTECSNGMTKLKNEMKLVKQSVSECTNTVNNTSVKSVVTPKNSKVDEGRSKANTKSSTHNKPKNGTTTSVLTVNCSTPSMSKGVDSSTTEPVLQNGRLSERIVIDDDMSYSAAVSATVGQSKSRKSTVQINTNSLGEAGECSLVNTNASYTITLANRAQKKKKNEYIDERTPTRFQFESSEPLSSRPSQSNNKSTLEDDVNVSEFVKRRTKRYFFFFLGGGEGGFKPTVTQSKKIQLC